MSNAGPKARSWERKETRHHCPFCNAWMASDKQSILLHENGKKHRENVEKSLQKQRQTKAEREKASQLVQGSLAQMEAAALRAHVLSGDAIHFSGAFGVTGDAPVTAAQPPPPPPSSPSSVPPLEKHHRQDRKAAPKDRKLGVDDGDDDDTRHVPKKRRHRAPPEPGQGHYEEEVEVPGSVTTKRCRQVWLEGPTFGAGLLEVDLPVQLWTGPLLAPRPHDRRHSEFRHHWRDAVVVGTVHQRKESSSAGAAEQNDVDEDSSEIVGADVAYLESPDASEETLLRDVPLDRIRILLGDKRDDRIPDTLEEARILAAGGIEEVVAAPTDYSAAVDDATGLSGWTTVAVKRTTARLELREERIRIRAKRREAEREAARQAKLAEARKMEEARVANADDSALGAYDVWNRGAKEGYKGVDIHGEVPVEAHELGKKLAVEGSVGFKKPAFKAKSRLQNRRKTTSDD